MLFAAGCTGTPGDDTSFGGDDYTYEREQGTSTMLKFSSSDEGLDAFLNDYLHRHLRYDDMRIGSLSLGASVMFNKEWEAMSLMYFDSETSVPDDRYAMIKDWTVNVPVDKYGYVWSNKEELQPNLFSAATYFGQGWPFPDYTLSGGDSQGWNWDDSGNAEGWTVRLNGNEVTPDVTSGLISVENSRIETVEFTSDPSTTYMVPKHTPFLEIDIRLNDFSNIGSTSGFDDIIVEWKKSDGVWHQVSYKDYATYVTNIGATFNKKIYLPMYLHPYWGRSNDSSEAIRQLRITVKSKEGVKVNGGVKMNYVHGQYDTRQTNNNALLLRAARMYYEYTGDNEYLAENLVRFRKAAEFLIGVCGGEDGLISMKDFFVGHEGGTNMMTASWGGLGYLYNRPVAFCFINPARHTYRLMEKAGTYTLTFYAEDFREALRYCGTHSGRDGDKIQATGLTPAATPSGAPAFKEARLVIECRKMLAQSLSPDALHDEGGKGDEAAFHGLGSFRRKAR